ncbi:unnamed protein product [Coregonus sp. 'balchen']|nr:unnamed protein product [Coregonus sp. 'balchen']
MPAQHTSHWTGFIFGYCSSGSWVGRVSDTKMTSSAHFSSTLRINVRVKQPIFFINSEKFQWAGNIMRMRKLVPPDSTSTQRKMVTIKGTVHQSFPDFTFLTGNWIGKILKLKGEIDPQVAIDLCTKASLAFLQRHLGMDKDFNQWDHLIEGKDDNLIPGTNVTEIP